MSLCGGGCGCGCGHGESNSCTKLYILRYHFIFVCPISYFLSESVWSAKQIGGCGEVSVDVVRWVWVWL